MSYMDRFDPPPFSPHPRSYEEYYDEEMDSWDKAAYKRYYPIEDGGEDIEFFTMGALAEALNRRPVTMRLWESKGWLPTPSYRTPSNGAIAGKRLYTRDQIEGIIKIAKEEGVYPSNVSPVNTNFTKRALELFKTELRNGTNE